MLKHITNRKSRARLLIAAVMLSMLMLSSTGLTTALAQGPSGNGTPPALPDGAQPEGAPPDGAAPGGGTGDTGTNPVLTTTCGTYTLDGTAGDASTDQAYDSATGDMSAICVINGGTLTLTNPTITKTGETSSSDSSSFYGLNAAVLAGSGSTVTISGGTVTANGSGANGVFSTGDGSTVTLSDMTINAYGDGAHAVMATLGGTMILTNVDMNTTDAHSGAVATDRGSGTITVTGGTITTSGQDFPGIYSTGVITVSDATVIATGAEAAVIEGANSIILNNTDLSSSFADKWGVMIYQSMSGDAEGAEGVFTMTGGSLAYTAANSPLFFITNSTAIITLTGVDVTAASGTLVNAAATDRWGTSGANGGTVILTADAQTLVGDMAADSISTLTVTLQNGSSLTGAINAGHTAQTANLMLDETSTWNVTADSTLTCLDDASGISGTSITNIMGNGHTVTYDASACTALGGGSYTLQSGGELVPAN